MKKITVITNNTPLIVFNSDNWKNENDEIEAIDEIIDFIKQNKNDFEYFLLQNRANEIGDTKANPIILVRPIEYGGFLGTVETYIKDVINDLIQENNTVDG